MGADNGNDTDSGSNIDPQLLVCENCGETMHSFSSYDGVPTPPIEDPALEPADRLAEDPKAGQAIWNCWQCGTPRFGPDPDGDTEYHDDYEDSFFNNPQNPLEVTTLNALHHQLREDEEYDKEQLIQRIQNESYAETEEIEEILDDLILENRFDDKSPTLLETEVIEAMNKLGDEGAVKREDVINAIQNSHSVSNDEINDAIDNILFRGECYELDSNTLKLI